MMNENICFTHFLFIFEEIIFSLFHIVNETLLFKKNNHTHFNSIINAFNHIEYLKSLHSY